MRVLLVGAALLLMFVSAILFLVDERKISGRLPLNDRFQVTGHVTGDFAGTPWAGTVVKLGTEQALVPPNGRFNFAVPPGRYPIGVCCSSEFQAIHDVVEVVDRDVVLTLVARPLIEITGKISVTGDVPALQGFAISAVLQGTNVVGRAVSDVEGRFSLRLGEGRWMITIDNLPEGYAAPEIHHAGSRLTDNVLVIAASHRRTTIQIFLKRAA